jgi:hypothetical protein
MRKGNQPYGDLGRKVSGGENNKGKSLELEMTLVYLKISKFNLVITY